MFDGLASKVALVTGGGRNLGREVAIALARQGCAVAILSRTQADLEETKRRIEADGGKALIIVADVTDHDRIRHAIEVTEDAFGSLDILVNVAGGFVISPALDGDISTFQAMHDLNVLATFNACAVAAQRMAETGGGSIVNFGSILATTTFPGRAAYAASKAAVVHMTQTLGVEWAPLGIRVNSVSPGMIAIDKPHPLVETSQLREEDFLARIPCGRRGTPQDVVGAVLFLASDHARYIIGHDLIIDGGWTANGYI